MRTKKSVLKKIVKSYDGKGGPTSVRTPNVPYKKPRPITAPTPRPNTGPGFPATQLNPGGYMPPKPKPVIDSGFNPRPVQPMPKPRLPLPPKYSKPKPPSMRPGRYIPPTYQELALKNNPNAFQGSRQRKHNQLVDPLRDKKRRLLKNKLRNQNVLGSSEVRSYYN